MRRINGPSWSSIVRFRGDQTCEAPSTGPVPVSQHCVDRNHDHETSSVKDSVSFLLPSYLLRLGEGFTKWSKKVGKLPSRLRVSGDSCSPTPSTLPGPISVPQFWILSAARATIPPKKCNHPSVPSPRLPHPLGGGRARGSAVARVAVMSMLGKERDPSPMPLTLPHQLLEGLLCQVWSGAFASSGLPTTDRCSCSPPIKPASTKRV